jgi:UPF0271 protein
MRVDLNADVGEGCGQDLALMRCITSANVACGGHAGDLVTIRDTVRLARDHGVGVGAHPGFADREGFGRREIELPSDALTKLVSDQVTAIRSIAIQEGAPLRHVKPHGALYNMAVRDRRIADAVARAVAAIDSSLIVLCLPGSELIAAARAVGLPVAREGFADRAYRPDGTLVPRTEAGAVLEDPTEVLVRVIPLARRADVDTICVHGDTPGAATLAFQIRTALGTAGIDVKALTA